MITIACIPAYNEEQSIAKIILGSKKYVDIIVVVDDGSSDATSDIAHSLGAHVVRHEQNEGYGAALRTCFRVAREIGADRMVIIDADGQHDPEEIPKLLLPLSRGADLVIGSRFCNGNGKDIPAYRKIGMKVLDITTSIAGGISVTDSQSGFRAYSKRAIDSICIDENGMSAGSEILLQAKNLNFCAKEVPITNISSRIKPDVARTKINKKSITIMQLADSYIINCIYAFSLMLISSIILYTFFNLLQFGLKFSLLILSAYLAYEIISLFYSKSFFNQVYEYILNITPTRRFLLSNLETSSYPTLAVIISTPFTLIYLLLRQWDLYSYGWAGIKVAWAITKYNITNPKWIYSEDYEEIRFIGRKGLTLDKMESNHLCQWRSKSAQSGSIEMHPHIL